MIIYLLFCTLGLQENEELQLNIASLTEQLNNAIKYNSSSALENKKTLTYGKKEGGWKIQYD